LVCQTYITHCNNYKDKMKIAKTSQNSFQLISLRIFTYVLTNPQLWITHPLPLSELTCLQPAIAASLAVPWDSFSYSSDCSDRIPKCQRDGKGIETSTCTVFMRFFFSLHEYYLANPNGGSVRNWISNNISKFHENPTVNETGIIVLLRQFWVSTGN